MTRHARTLACLACLACLATTATVARAEPTEAERRADALFTEGRKLLDAGDAVAACPKFEESQRLDPGLGTLLNLADCYERTGRLASALTTFRAAEEQARALGEAKREAAAADRVRSLESRASRLLIRLTPGPRPSGFIIERDGVEVPAFDLGRPIAVDPGTITIRASAPGHVRFETKVDVPTVRAEKSIEVPLLAMSPGGDAPPPEVFADPGRGRRRIGLVTAAAGVAGLGAGIGLGLVARGRYRDAGCDGGVCVEGADVDAANQARSLGNVGTVIGAVGVAALAAGAIVWVTAPGAHRVTLTPTAGVDGASVSLSGRF
ncbi:MAG: tetratricopeptide repeat protein [Kofleriaceae bacterium]